MTDISALKKAVKLLAHAVNATIEASDEDTTMGKVMEYQQLIPDIIALLPEIGDLDDEAKALDSEAYAALIAELSNELVLPVGKTEKVVKASLKLLADLIIIIVPDVKAIIDATKAA